MFDMSWGEVMLIGGVALVVIGPKELPRTLRTVGQVTAKLRRMSAEFMAQFNEAMREAELDDVKRDVEGLNRSVSSSLSPGFNPIQTIRDEIKSSIEAKTPAASSPAALPPPYEYPTYDPPSYEPPADVPAALPSSEALADATARLEAERTAEPAEPGAGREVEHGAKHGAVETAAAEPPSADREPAAPAPSRAAS